MAIGIALAPMAHFVAQNILEVSANIAHNVLFASSISFVVKTRNDAIHPVEVVVQYAGVDHDILQIPPGKKVRYYKRISGEVDDAILVVKASCGNSMYKIKTGRRYVIRASLTKADVLRVTKNNRLIRLKSY